LDEALICHVGFSMDARTWVVPTAFARMNDAMYFHGATGNLALRALAAGVEACITVTLLDGLVPARSAFHHSMNYRSVVLFGHGEAIVDPAEKRDAVLAILEHVVPGRSESTRAPSLGELRSTLVVRFRIDEGSAKIRAGGPIDEPEDMVLP
jgi:nitroimidazol reductase NimA-like FMN-containing flavoprotein (pyridoxamine 5'-phosphate oxidase superfamily)